MSQKPNTAERRKNETNASLKETEVYLNIIVQLILYKPKQKENKNGAKVKRQEHIEQHNRPQKSHTLYLSGSSRANLS